ncbi:hypothetical protein Hypma_000313 [Hypsizygus marmoreus]|uniref:Uncharacterized protein n=1 Tax=Hypsizygus marmoreus TaxID=39966 RepID=A0A369J9C2_HYPMA|nr:hypothetical protein Hypma_000313 [Hypsizygus marmoreus]
MGTPKLALGAIHNIDDLPKCSPYLMPFHIDYSGQAPISTYLRVEAANETVGAPPRHNAENTTKIGSSTDLDIETTTATAAEDETNPDANSIQKAEMPPTPEPTLLKRVTDATTRFISSFRGRTIHGLKVELPSGYVGVVLRAEGAGETKGKGREMEKTNAKSNGKMKANGKKNATKRKTRSAARAEEDEDYERKDEGDEVNGDAMYIDVDADAEKSLRTLIPSSQFSSFVLWHADNPVDEGRDEFFRSLTEWTRLAAEIHRMEP